MTEPTLQPGQQVLHYRIAEKIGEGGMGEVWRATDTDLDREVAIKVLPAMLANDGERMARFQREARLLASLNHPHIATIHGLHEGDTDGNKFRFLVMELVEGEDLAQAIEQGLSFDRAIEIAVQITQALEAAHTNGIVHRDLKPANIKLTSSGEVKVLDFGLAKAVGVEAQSGSGVSPTLSPTITSAGTVAGTILGTAAYMSPEQARGRAVDRRSDMWAFGCLLYELLSGRRAFGGETISDTLVAVLKETPEWSALPEQTPVGVRRLLRRCLEKDARKRWSDAADARLELEEAFQPSPESEQVAGSAVTVEAPKSASVLPWIVAAAAIVLAVFLGVRGRTPVPQPQDLLSLTLTVPDGVMIEDDQATNVALAADGRHLVYSGIDEGGQSALYVRQMDSGETLLLAGTENAENPFFSPDGEWIAYFVEDTIKKTPVAGGPSVEVCKGVGSPRGAAWGRDDRMIFPRHFDSALWQVPGSGGTATPLTELDPERQERTHRFPQIVPGYPLVLFTVATLDTPEYYDTASIDVLNLETGERKTVFEGASFARYAPSGHLIFGREGSLWAIPFDIASLAASGTPTPVLPNVMGVRNSGVVFASLARNGMLAYVEGQPEDLRRELLWRYFDGRTEAISTLPIAGWVQVALSPDGKKIAASISGSGVFDIWVHDIETGSRTRLTFEGDSTKPLWTPDGQSVIYASIRDGLSSVYMKAADGSGAERLLARPPEGSGSSPESVSADGRTLLIGIAGAKKNGLFTLDLDDPEAKEQLLFDSPADETLAKLSPDGRWIAYTSDESGDYEVMVRPTSGGGGRWQISTDGGLLPRWSRDGKQLFYRVGRKLYGLDVETGPDTNSFGAGVPRLLFDDLKRARLNSSYEVSRAGDAVLLPSSLQDLDRLDRVTVLINWLDEVERLVPSER